MLQVANLGWNICEGSQKGCEGRGRLERCSRMTFSIFSVVKSHISGGYNGHLNGRPTAASR